MTLAADHESPVDPEVILLRRELADVREHTLLFEAGVGVQDLHEIEDGAATPDRPQSIDETRDASTCARAWSVTRRGAIGSARSPMKLSFAIAEDPGPVELAATPQEIDPFTESVVSLAAEVCP